MVLQTEREEERGREGAREKKRERAGMLIITLCILEVHNYSCLEFYHCTKNAILQKRKDLIHKCTEILITNGQRH